MDFHNTSLDQYEFMQDMLERGRQLKEEEPKKVYYIAAYQGKDMKWDTYVDDEDERKATICDAVANGYTYTVETEIV